jgi:hypothetical protein
MRADESGASGDYGAHLTLGSLVMSGRLDPRSVPPTSRCVGEGADE